ncbi:S8 family serine peptidase [Actinokineospora sp. NBRC 105648]|uniref:S8 family serine peptidase n=1 Tax=Actinokineospora sp. NBRC 105648 TaxID=3032206 RepID=UPI0024A5F432|nr:S8 family serine peptidase [Actinokineospora sp. NBRC 105648]GLZ38931.1 peptidase S8 [Actinokineospora sp. NBRC 105648]
MSTRIVWAGLAAALLAVSLPLPAAAQAGQCAPAENTVAKPEPWAQRRLAAERVWPMTKGAGPVAVVDTGVSTAAPALAGAVTGGDGADCAGHGTFLAGLIAARPQPGTEFAGIAPGVGISAFRVTDEPTKVDPRRLAAGIDDAVNSGARVVAVGVLNTVDVPELRAAVEHARARDVVLIAPAAVRQAKQQAFPASAEGVLAVAPVGPDGPTKATLGAQPMLGAPAEQLVGIGPAGPGHRLASGPELAVAFVAGAAALVCGRYPELSARAVVDRLTSTADRPAGQVPNPMIGFGIVDPVAAVNTLDTGARVMAPPKEHLVVPLPPVEDTGPARAALWFVAALAGVGALAGTVSAVVVRGKRRAWRARPAGPPAG